MAHQPSKSLHIMVCTLSPRGQFTTPTNLEAFPLHMCYRWSSKSLANECLDRSQSIGAANNRKTWFTKQTSRREYASGWRWKVGSRTHLHSVNATPQDDEPLYTCNCPRGDDQIPSLVPMVPFINQTPPIHRSWTEQSRRITPQINCYIVDHGLGNVMKWDNLLKPQLDSMGLSEDHSVLEARRHSPYCPTF